MDAERAPIVLFAYARPWHTETTLRSLAANHGASAHDLIVYLDGPRSADDAVAVAQVFEVVAEFAGSGRFRSVGVTRSARNRGLAGSVIRGVGEVLASHETAIVLEDDLLLAPDFLTYMDDALTVYADDPRIWSISGYTPPLATLTGRAHDLYLSLRASSWGWGTWRRNWTRVDWAVQDYARFEFDLLARRAFNRGGRDLAAMLDAQMDGRVDSWAIRWCYAQHTHGMYSVTPATSKVRNIGLDGSGTHRVVETAAAGPPAEHAVRFGPLAPEREVLREFAGYHARYNTVPPYSFTRHLRAKLAPGRRLDSAGRNEVPQLLNGGAGR